MKIKATYYLFFLALTLMISSCEEKLGNPIDTTKAIISLDGAWQFKADTLIVEKEVLADNSKWDSLPVPSNWDTTEKYSEYVGKAYYKRSFDVPTEWKGKQVRINFGAVYQTSKVWVNGNLLGTHVGGYLPFEYNITNHINFDRPNEVVVMADNTYKRGAWWAWGGISRSVSLKANNAVRIVQQHIVAIPDFDKKEVNFNIAYTLENNSRSNQSITIQPSIEGISEIESATTKVPKGSAAHKVSVTFKRPLADVKLWHYKTPNLYHLESSLTVNGTTFDIVKDRFGIRKFEVKGDQFFLNNQPERLNGVNRVHDHPKYGNTEPDVLVEQDMKDIISLGCRFSRLMHAPLSKNILDFCDENGFLLIEEIPVWGDFDPQAKPNNPLTKQWMKGLIERDFNHPSVVGWSVGNELRTDKPKWGKQHLTKDMYAYTNEMLDYVAELDSTRLKTYVSNTAYQGGKIGNEPYEKIDFMSVNSYGHALKIVEKVRTRFPDKPIFLSEIGRGQIGPAPDAKLKDDLVEFITKLKDFPYVTGVSIWSYNDYRSNYKGTPESGFREWGIVSETREKKKAYQQLKEVYEEWETYKNTPKSIQE